MYDQRPSSLAQVEYFWHMTADQDGHYPQSISPLWGFVFMIKNGQMTAWLQGPFSQPRFLHYYKGERYWGVVFKESVLLRNVTKADLLNCRKKLPAHGESSIYVGNKVLFVPNFAHLELFVQELIERELLIDDTPLLTKPARSMRTRQRAHKKITGLTPQQIAQAQRVQKTIMLLGEGFSLANIAHQTGFADQAHMTRELKTLAGLTPKRLRDYYYSNE